MAALDAFQTVQVANVDLAIARQKLLREKLDELFVALSKRAKTKKRLIYTINTDEAALDRVLRLNTEADALFTGLNYDKSHSDSLNETLSIATPEDLLAIEPQLRYPLIAEFLNAIDRGQLRHRRLFLVGDIYEKIGQFLRSALPVFVTVHGSGERTQVTPPVQISSIDRLDRDPQAELVEGKPIPVRAIVSIQVADIPFQGIINMPEEGNRFVFKDQTVIDAARKLYLTEGAQARVVRERVAEEKRTFVRGKKVFILLEPDLEHVISDRFLFDEMEYLYRHHTLEEALKALEGGRSQGIVDYFEREGYHIVFDLLHQEERDKLLIAVLGDRLTEYLLKEVQAVKPLIAQLEDSDLESLFYNLPTPVVDQVLEQLKEKNFERFLSMVPQKIRERVILEFLNNPKYIQAAWRVIGGEEQKEILNSQAHLVHAVIYLLDSPLSKQKFPALKFEFERSYTSAMLPKLGRDEQKATFSTIARSLEARGVPKGLIARQLSPAEIEHFVVAYVSRNASEFYNRLNPAIRKQIWLTVGRQYKEHISRNLHALDKIEILKGSKEATVGLVFANAGFMSHLQSGEDREFSATLFLILKKLNKGESRTALLKTVLTASEWKPYRIKGVPALLTDPHNGLIFEKLSERVEELEFKFDSLVCTKDHYQHLKDLEPFAGAVVTLVDDLVDPSLYNLFERGDLSREDYDQFSKSVEKEIANLRRKMAAKETEDPIGVYVLETMMLLNGLSNEAMSGKLSEDALAKLDERMAIRQRMLDSMQEHLRRIDDYLEKAQGQLPLFEEKIAQAQQLAEQQGRLFDQQYAKAGKLLKEFQQSQQMQARALQGRKKVALAQKELSSQFFEIIQPLILDKVRSLGSPLKSLLRMVGLGDKGSAESDSKRVIFKFSDEEIENILRYKIVFCAKNPMLAQFVATCLRIDKLEDSLFTLATAETLPQKSDIDILFYGPSYAVEDFSDSVKKNRMVPFADQDFHDRLTANEHLKARTKAVLAKTATMLADFKPRMQSANGELKGHQAKRRQLETDLANLKAEKAQLQENFASQRERRHRYEGELELMESRLAEVDGKFEALRSRLTQLLADGGGQATTMLQAGQQEMAEQLRDDLTALNKELARMMYIKGVKDAGESISHNTQNEILRRVDVRETYPFAKRPFRKLIVADDGKQASQNLKRVFVNVAMTYFKLRDMAVQDISIKRLLALAENSDRQSYPFVALFCDRPEDNYMELKLSVKKIRNHLPDTYQLVIAPLGDLGSVDRASPYFKNLLSLKELCTLVNADLGNIGEPANMLKVLREKAPLS